MGSLSKELIIKLANESDVEVLKQWDDIEEVEPDEEEIKIINDFKNNSAKYEFVSIKEGLI